MPILRGLFSPTGLYAAAGLACTPVVARALLRARREPWISHQTIDLFGVAVLVFTWAVLIPLKLVDHLVLDDRLLAWFGAGRVQDGVVGALSAAGLAGVAAIAFRLARQARAPAERIGWALATGIALLAFGIELDWGWRLARLLSASGAYPAAADPLSLSDGDYRLAGWLAIGAGLLAGRIASRPGPLSAAAGVVRESRYAAALLATTGLLMQSGGFGELRDALLPAAMFYIIGHWWLRQAGASPWVSRPGAGWVG